MQLRPNDNDSPAAPPEIRLMRGDCLEILPTLADASFDAVITDPPYASLGDSLTGGSRSSSASYQNSNTRKLYPDFAGVGIPAWIFPRWCEKWGREAYRVLRRGGWFLCFSDFRGVAIFAETFAVLGFRQTGIFVWDKEHSRPQRGDFRKQTEFVLVFRKAGADVPRVAYCAPGVYRGAISPKERLHCTGKPVALMETLMSVLPPRSRVLDPFAGSASTLVAARNLGHSALGIEITAEYATVAERRLAEPVPAPCKPLA